MSLEESLSATSLPLSKREIHGTTFDATVTKDETQEELDHPYFDRKRVFNLVLELKRKSVSTLFITNKRRRRRRKSNLEQRLR